MVHYPFLTRPISVSLTNNLTGMVQYHVLGQSLGAVELEVAVGPLAHVHAHVSGGHGRALTERDKLVIDTVIPYLP